MRWRMHWMPEHEVYRVDGGLIRLSELAEEELLLALPIVPACAAPQSCGNAPIFAAGDRISRKNRTRRAGRSAYCRIC